MFLSLGLNHTNYCHELVTVDGGMDWMIGFIAHLHNLLLNFTNQCTTNYVCSSQSSSTTASRNSLNSILSHSQSQSYFTSVGLPPISSPCHQAPWDSRPVIFFQLKPCCHNPYVTSSLKSGWVCRLQLLLALASAVILGSESHGTHDHILLSQIRDTSNLEGQFPVFISPRNTEAQL
jgi:hypothetical protein